MRSVSLLRAGLLACGLGLVACAEVQEFQQGSGFGPKFDNPLMEAGAGLLQGVPEPREIAMGQEMSAALLGAADLDADASVQEYVNRVGLWIVQQSERDHLPWRFGVLETPAMNAFAAPGGYVFITRGLFDALQSEAELAGVLAHEIAHVLRRHHLDAIRQDHALDLASELVAASGHADAVEELPPEVKARVGNAAKALYARGLNRADEYEADQVGAVLMARAGYDPLALAAVLHELDRIGGTDDKLRLMFETHPSPSDRLTSLAPILEDRFAGGGYAELGARYRKYRR